MGSSTSLRLAWTTRSAMVGIPSFRNFPVFPLGIITRRTSSGVNPPDFNESRIWPRAPALFRIVRFQGESPWVRACRR
jgi:hypothetical protein